AIAAALGLPENRVRVTACTMGGCFGSGAQYTDNAIGAALMSQAVGAPVRVQLMRWDEIGYDRYGPAQLMDVRAGIDSRGNLVAIDFTNINPQWGGVNWNATLAGAPPAAPFSWVAFAPGSMYNSPNQRYTVKALQLTGNWISGSALRTVGGHAITFAIEQVIDELAHAAKMDPVAFRIQNVVQGNDWTKGQRQDQLLAVLNTVTKAANWQPRVSASNLSDANIVTGRGVAWEDIHHPINNGLTATIADVEVNKKTGKVTVKHVYQAATTGLAVYPGGIENQILGGTVQSVSWTVAEQLRFSRTNVASSDFVSYPILRFKDAPKVTVNVLQWDTYSQTPYAAGIGEDGINGPPAAIANAFFDATGVRMRTAPLTPARVRAALKAAGVA
ncbi:MAG: xanthine dehydrogenase family protein molybdopterin-binding subunit, partial [Solirubrobacteraceae bacterium]